MGAGEDDAAGHCVRASAGPPVGAVLSPACFIGFEGADDTPQNNPPVRHWGFEGVEGDGERLVQRRITYIAVFEVFGEAGVGVLLGEGDVDLFCPGDTGSIQGVLLVFAGGDAKPVPRSVRGSFYRILVTFLFFSCGVIVCNGAATIIVGVVFLVCRRSSPGGIWWCRAG